MTYSGLCDLARTFYTLGQLECFLPWRLILISLLTLRWSMLWQFVYWNIWCCSWATCYIGCDTMSSSMFSKDLKIPLVSMSSNATSFRSKFIFWKTKMRFLQCYVWLNALKATLPSFNIESYGWKVTGPSVVVYWKSPATVMANSETDLEKNASLK